MEALKTAPQVSLLMLLVVGCGGQPPPDSANDFEAGRPGQRAYVDVSGRPVLPPTAVSAPDRQPGQSAVLGAVSQESQVREKIVAGALAGKEAEPRVPPTGLADQLAANGRRNVKGMVPSGTPLSAELGEGEHAVGRWTLSPAACYAVVTACTEQLTSMQINLIAAPPRPPQLLVQSEFGATPTLGSAECLSSRSASPLEVLVDIYVIRGHGTVALQLYRR